MCRYDGTEVSEPRLTVREAVQALASTIQMQDPAFLQERHALICPITSKQSGANQKGDSSHVTELQKRKPPAAGCLVGFTTETNRHRITELVDGKLEILHQGMSCRALTDSAQVTTPHHTGYSWRTSGHCWGRTPRCCLAGIVRTQIMNSLCIY